MFEGQTAFAPLLALPSKPLPLASRLLGLSPDQVASRAPQLFTVSRQALTEALRLAVGQSQPAATVAREILRDHLLRIFALWPGHLGQSSRFSPKLRHDPESCLQALFGPVAKAPSTPDAMFEFLQSGQGVAPLLSQISDRFPPGTACTRHLRLTRSSLAFDITPQENNPSVRHADHPGLKAVEHKFGRGPLWRAFGRVLDLGGLCLGGTVPQPTQLDGCILAHGTRGLYAMRVDLHDGRVTDFQIVTPTDHLLARHGVLEQSLASLPAASASLGPLLLDILDPERPVSLIPSDEALAVAE